MKRKFTVYGKMTAGVVGLCLLGLGTPLRGADLPRKPVPTMQYEMVPHVVLPETVQYDPIAKNLRTPNFGTDHAGDYGMVSPFVGTYTPFPSYQLPYPSEMRTVNQSVYPVSPKMLPQQLPANKVEETTVAPEEDEIVLDDQNSPFDELSAPILLASASEEVVHAVPQSALSNDVTQTGIFCQKPAKPPAAWSFTSPVFKVASVPAGWGPNGQNGYIQQQGPRGCMTQVGFQAANGMAPGMEGAMMPNGMMQPPMHTFQMGRMGQMNPGGPQMQMLPNGMLMLTMPPDHSNCGLLRCRCGNQPRVAILPGAPGGMPGAMPQQGMMPGMMPQGMNPMMAGMMPQGAHPMMMPGMNPMSSMMPMSPMQMPMMQVSQGGLMPGMMPQQGMAGMMQQPMMMPVTAMTPYGMTVVGYQAVPGMNPMMMGGNGMVGMGMMPQQTMQAMMQQQQPMPSANENASKENAEGKDEAAQELKAPLPIGSNMQALQGMMVTPYGLYATQAGADQNGADSAAMQQQAMNPMMMPMMMPQQQVNPYAGMYMTPFGMMMMNPQQGLGMQYGMMQPNMMGMGGMMQPNMMGMGGMMQPNMMGMGGMMQPNMMGMGGMMMPVGMNPMMQQPQQGQGGLTTSDVIQLIMLLKANEKPARPGLIGRLREMRANRQARMQQNDPLQQLMQAWTTPYSPADTAMRMPSRSAYPYGYFGAQAADMSTANYGGYYNLYMGNTSYPGLY